MNEIDESGGWRGLYPFASRFLDQGAVRQHYLDEGEGEPVVMVHGNPTWSFYYRGLVAGLRDRCRTIVPDHIGMGLSDKPQAYPYTLRTHIDNLEALIQHAVGEQQSVSLVVHDWGGAIACGWAARHPHRVKRLVVLNTAAFQHRRIPWRISVCRWPLIGSLLLRGANAFVRAALTMAVERPLVPEVRAGYLAPYGDWASRVGVCRFVQDIPRRTSQPSYGQLAAVEAGLSRLTHVPMLIQWGGKDWCFNRSFYDQWRKRFPNAEAQVYEEAGHYVLEDAGDAVLERVRAFWDAHP